MHTEDPYTPWPRHWILYSYKRKTLFENCSQSLFRRTPPVVHDSSENLSTVVGGQANVVFVAGFHGHRGRAQFAGTYDGRQSDYQFDETQLRPRHTIV